MSTVRKPAVAGMFYPGDPQTLSSEVDELLGKARQARAAVLSGGEAPFELANLRALIVPHAGYIYSGFTAAKGYNVLAERVAAGEDYVRIVIVGPTHRVPVYGLAYPTATEFLTPLGAAPIWTGLNDGVLEDIPDIEPNDATHRDEHAIEVQIPFLQKILPDVPVIPLNAGQATGEQVADVLDELVDDETLLVISSDLSHYLPYDDAVKVDSITIGQILSLHGPLISQQACGATPINGVIEMARRHNWFPLLLDACNSGDTAGDKDRVVGYCAIAFYAPSVEENSSVGANESTVATANQMPSLPLVEEAAMAAVSKPRVAGVPDPRAHLLPDSAGPILLATARAAIEKQLGVPVTSAPSKWGDWADLQRGVFVTLNKDGQLRGCIGTLSDDRPLTKSVPANAVNAAVHDPRFPPLNAGELPEIEVEVSVLTDAEPVLISDGAGGVRAPRTEAEAVAALRPGVDGVILRRGWNQATFLPQVWEQLPDPVEFLAHLRAKAGLPPRAWDDRIELERYQVQSFEEH